MEKREGQLHDYLATSFAGLAFGIAVSAPATQAAGNWGPYVAIVIVAGIFGFIPSGFTVGYLNFRFHRTGENVRMVGFYAGLFAALVYTIVTLVGTVVLAIAVTQLASIYFIAWIILVVFAFVFMPIGGYLSGMLEEKPMAAPGFLTPGNVPPPPPPTSAVQQCKTCNKPFTFVQ